ncbi:MAG: RNA-binding protein [Deltaproteobacteria bacterium]|nr:RNA-binding protein [Deltaproteobacteria bacterium]
MDKTVTFNETWTTLFIGNLPFDLGEKDIRSLLEPHGAVNAMKLLTHPESGESQGICFAEMTHQGAEAAIAALDGQELEGRRLRVRIVQKEDVEDTLPT